MGLGPHNAPGGRHDPEVVRVAGETPGRAEVRLRMAATAPRWCSARVLTRRSAEQPQHLADGGLSNASRRALCWYVRPSSWKAQTMACLSFSGVDVQHLYPMKIRPRGSRQPSPGKLDGGHKLEQIALHHKRACKSFSQP